MTDPIVGKSKTQWECSVIAFLLLYSVLNSALFQGPLYARAFQTLGRVDAGALLSVVTLFVLQLTASLALLTMTSLNSVRFTQWVCVALMLASSVALFFIVAYGVILDESMMGNVLSTRADEARDFVNPRLAAFVVFLGLVPGLLISKVKIARTPRRKILAFGLATFVAGLSWMYANASTWLWLDKNAKVLGGLTLPWSYVVISVRYYEDSVQGRSPALLPATAVVDPEPVVVVLVIGEAARAQNFSLYGYPRATNPLLAQERVVAMPNTRSCSTYTTESLRCMLSRAGEQTGSSVTEEILPNYLQRNGIKVIWRSNNWGEPTLHVSSRLSAEDLRRQCKNADCQTSNHDEVLLFDLEKQIRDAGAAKVFVVLHEAGSHGPEYFRKYPKRFEVFKPVCAAVDPQKCTHEELVNAYDNSILYTDFVLSGVIHSLQSLRVPSVMLYVSDHGESLGEYGLYLHGTPYAIAPKFQTQVPFIVWMSDSFEHYRHLDGRRLDALPAYSQSFVFHTVMGALGLRSSIYDKDLDVFAQSAAGAVMEMPMQQWRTKGGMPENPSAERAVEKLQRGDRQRFGSVTSLVLLVTLAGCAGGTIGVGGFSGGVGVGVSAPIGQAPYIVSEGEQVIQPGMTSSEVIQRLGHLYYQFGVRQDNATVWNYRMRYGSCLIYQVSILPNGIVKDASTAPDPACDAPDGRRW